LAPSRIFNFRAPGGARRNFNRPNANPKRRVVKRLSNEQLSDPNLHPRQSQNQMQLTMERIDKSLIRTNRKKTGWLAKQKKLCHVCFWMPASLHFLSIAMSWGI